MRIKIIILIVGLLSAACFLIPARKAHESFVGSPPQPSMPYNIMDYTKPAAKP